MSGDHLCTEQVRNRRNGHLGRQKARTSPAQQFMVSPASLGGQSAQGQGWQGRSPAKELRACALRSGEEHVVNKFLLQTLPDGWGGMRRIKVTVTRCLCLSSY